MINLDELKPILSEILGDREDQASIIERVTAIDKPVDTPPADYQKQIDELNKSWEKRFKDTFFKPAEKQDTPEQKTYDNPAGGQSDVSEPKLTYDNLFTKGDG